VSTKKKIVMLSLIPIMFVVLFVSSILFVYHYFDLKQFRQFTATIINESDHQFVKLELGVVQGDYEKTGSFEVFDKVIKPGEKLKLKPDIFIRGEGGIYLELTDEQGKVTTKGVCSYTESISGYSTVTITNEDIVVEEKCW